MISNLVTKVFPILACRVACSAVPVSFPRNGFVVVAFNALTMVAVRVLGVFEYDVGPCGAVERHRSGRRRDLGLLAGLIIRSTALSKKNNENENKRSSCQKSPHRILPPSTELQVTLYELSRCYLSVMRHYALMNTMDTFQIIDRVSLSLTKRSEL